MEDSCSSPPMEHVVEGEEDEEEEEDSPSSTLASHGFPTTANPTTQQDQQQVLALSEESAPVDFQVPSSDSEDEEKFDQLLPTGTGAETPFMDKVPCPLCKRKRKLLTCKQCLIKGDFCVQNRNYRNATQSKERYCELMTRFQSAQRSRDHLRTQCALYTEKKGKISDIIEEMDKCQSSIAVQKQLRDVRKLKIKQANKESEVLKAKTEGMLKMWPVYRKRLENMQSQYISNCSKLKKFYGQVQNRQDNLKRGTKSRVIQLRHHVFPIEELTQNSKSSGLKGMVGSGSGTVVDSWSDEEDDTVRSLMVAKSNYWSRPDELVSSFGACYTITGPDGPTLPATGDYTAYNMWADRNQNLSGVTSGSAMARNPANCIAASLTYTTQFVNLIAYYLDLRLPHRLSYSEFTSGDLANGKFNRKVAKLNANVIHLCSSQGIHATSLQPRKTIANLLLLFDPEQADLGRRGPFEVASQLAKSMEDSIEKDLVIYEEGSSESDTEWNDSTFPSDWETINRAAICEEFGVQEMTAAECSSLTLSFAGGSSIYRSSSANSFGGGTGLLSSVTSFFRGWNK